MLSTTSQCALRSLCHLARLSDKAVLGRDLAQAVDIPANYLPKVLLTLRNAGLVETNRGSGGGYRLRKPANEIHLIDIVELFEEISRTKTPCFSGAHAFLLRDHALYSTFHIARPLGRVFRISHLNPAFCNRRKTGRSLDEFYCRHASH